MKVYLCARYARFPEMRGYARELEALGHTITSRWIRGDHELRAHGEAEADDWQCAWAFEDWHDIGMADTVIAFTESPDTVAGQGRSSRHTAFGIALACNKRCIAVGFREHTFYWLPHVQFYSTWEAYLETLHLKQETCP